MSRALDLELEPAEDRAARLRICTYTDAPGTVTHREMCETVKLAIESPNLSARSELTSAEARVLANQLLQVADACDEHRAAHEAERERIDSFERIQEEMRDADELGGSACYYAHPDVHYVPANQVAAKISELEAAGVSRYVVLSEFDDVHDDARGARHDPKTENAEAA